MLNSERYDENAICNIYIANLGKYNEGELVGGWIALPVEEEELNEFLKEVVGINDEYEEWAIHDYECKYLKIGEYSDIYELNEKIEEIEELMETDGDKIEAAFEAWGEEALGYDLDDIILYPDIDDEYDLGYYYVENYYPDAMKNNPLANYIDYAAFGRDIDLDTNGAFTSYGYVEYIG